MVSVRTVFSRTSLIASAIVLIASSASGASYYVDNSGSPACSNSSSFGTEDRPWCTITYGMSRLAGGDDLLVKQGTYNEALYINGPAGSSTKPTVIRSYPGHVVTIRGGGNTGRVKITSTSYITFDGFVVTNFNQGIFVEGNASHITIDNCVVHDVGQEGIHVKENSSYVTIQGCTVYNMERIGGCCNGEGIYVGTGSAGPLDNSHHVIVRNNTIHDVTDEAIELKPGTHDSIVENNTIHSCTDQGATTGSAIEFESRNLIEQSWNANPNHIIRGNVIHDCYVGIRVGSGVQVYNNIIYNTLGGRAGIVVTNSDGDGYTRYLLHNTIAMPSNAIVVEGGITDTRNNIGPTSSSNLAFNASHFVNAAAGDYHLRAGSAPIDAGLDLSSIVGVDKDGNIRPAGAFPDLGAYEFGQVAVLPSAPQNLRIVLSP